MISQKLTDIELFKVVIWESRGFEKNTIESFKTTQLFNYLYLRNEICTEYYLKCIDQVYWVKINIVII